MSAPSASKPDDAERRLLRDRVARYYRENQFFYDRFWTDRATRSMNYGFWDETTFGLGHAFRNQNRAIAEALRLEADDRVLEAGCGTGGATVCLAADYGVAGVGVTLCHRQTARGNFHAAEILYLRAHARQPKNPDTLYELGVFEFRRGNFLAAYRALNDAYTLDRYGPAGQKGGYLDKARRIVNREAAKQRAMGTPIAP